MKLKDVDETISEGIMDMVKGIVNVGMAAAGSRSARENAENIYAKNNFRNTFVRKMSALLASQWPQIKKNQEDLIQQQQFLQQQLKQKQAAMAQTGVKPAPIQPEAPGAPQVPPNAVSEAYKQFDKLYKKALVEAAPAAQPQQPVLNFKPLTMSDYLVKIIVQYMQGFDLNQSMQAITNFAKNVELTYPENHGIPALKKLGDMLYDLAAQQKDEKMPSPTPKPEEMSDSVERMLNNFKQMDPYDQKDFMAKVSEVAKKLGISS
jgi:uncharacterized protein (UPF0305 family)